jgi:hypothetical protein
MENNQMNNENELDMTVVKQVEAPVIQAMPLKQLQDRFDGVRTLIHQNFKEGIHWGGMPGTDKKIIFKAGTELAASLFQLRPEYSIKREDLSGGHREITVVTRLFAPNGVEVGQGVGSCSTQESKYRWRKAERVCPECGQPTIIKGKAEYGGGYLCWAKKGGCGAKFADGDPAIESQEVGRVENPDIADVYNTVLKMSKKRSFTDAVISTTGTSDLVTQDMDEPHLRAAMNMDDGPAPMPPQPEAPKPAPKKRGRPKKEDKTIHYYVMDKIAEENRPAALHFLEGLKEEGIAAYEEKFDCWTTVGAVSKLARAEITEEEVNNRASDKEADEMPNFSLDGDE